MSLLLSLSSILSDLHKGKKRKVQSLKYKGGEVWRFRNDPILFTLQTNVEKTSTSYLASSIFWGRLEVKTGYLVTGAHDTKKQRGGESAQKVKSVEVRIVPKSP